MTAEILPYSPAPESRRDRVYAIMLVLLAFQCCGSALTCFFASRMPSPPAPAQSKWVFEMAAGQSGFAAAIIVATLVFRARSRSNACLIWTKAFNIFLLLVFPFGTAVGVYGLWKIDKARFSPESRK